ncbi:MAG: hypothetical protein LBQ22_12905 [Bacteroidales bacterium]|jgi:peptidoglycan hydrolase CwlO-like protein|nr:hypothetical protein [Bacteroidales bacterium]
MKKYLLFVLIAAIAVSCSSKKDHQKKVVEKTVTTYVISNLDEPDSYEVISFESFDSVNVSDIKAYQDLKTEKNKIENNIQDLKARISNIENESIKEEEHLYSELKDELNKEEEKFYKFEKDIKKWERKEKEKIYSIIHKYKAKRDNQNEILFYEETFYVDRDGNIVEVVGPVYPHM